MTLWKRSPGVEGDFEKHLGLPDDAEELEEPLRGVVEGMALRGILPGCGRGSLEPSGEPPGVHDGGQPPGVEGTSSTTTTQRSGPVLRPFTPNSSAASPWKDRVEVEALQAVYDGACSPNSSSHRNSDSNYSSEFDNPTHQLLSSSPLSSPPPVLSDPFETASLTSCSHTPTRTSRRSESRLSTFDGTAEEESDGEDTEETQQTGTTTPYLASQSSFHSFSSRTTLPNLKGKDLFDANIWADPTRTSVFYTFATTLKQKARDVEPTTSHRFLGILRDSHKLVRCYTQNIDRLEERVGFTTALELGCGQRARFSARAIKQARESQGGVPTSGPKGQGLLQAGQDFSGVEETGPAAHRAIGRAQDDLQRDHGEGHSSGADEAASQDSPATGTGADANTREIGACVDHANFRVRGRVPANDRAGPSDREDILRGPNHALSESLSRDSDSIDARSVKLPQRQPSQPQDSQFLIPPKLHSASGAGDEDEESQGVRGDGEDIRDRRARRGEQRVGRTGVSQPFVAPTTESSDTDKQQPGATLSRGSGHSSSRSITTPPDNSLQHSTENPSPQPSQDVEHPSEPVPAASTASTHSLPNRGVECVYLHGSLHCLRCFLCGRTTSWDADKETDTLAGNQPTCPHCAGATAAREERGKRALGVGKLRPDIVLYGEEHPQSHLISPIVQHDLSLGPDMLLILGTSLRVHGLKVLVKEFAKAVHSKGGKVVFVNFTKPPESVWSDVIDFWVQWDCDAWVLDLKNRKPALWLPPGTVDENEPKAKPKAKRTSSALSSTKSENEKENDGSVIVKAKRRSTGGGPSKRKGQGSRLSLEQRDGEIAEPTANDNDNDEDAKISEEVVVVAAAAVPKLPSKMSTKREPKLDWNAKRPASTREDKKCGAFLTYQILQDLEKITGLKRPPFQLPVSLVASQTQAVPVAAVAPPKPRKKAAAPPRTPAPAPSPSRTALPSSMVPLSAPPLQTSITAAVKTNPRKRKRKTIDGVEVILPGEERRLRQAAVAATRTQPPPPPPPPPTPPPRQTILLPLPHPSISPRDVSASFTVPDVLPALNNSSSPPPGSSPLKLQPLEPSPQSLGPSGSLLGGGRGLFSLKYSDPLPGLTYPPPTPSWKQAARFHSVDEEAARTLELLQGGGGGR